jgi:hypothetical protein
MSAPKFGLHLKPSKFSRTSTPIIPIAFASHKMIRAYNIVPKELFRTNNGRFVRLRPWKNSLRQRRFDISLTDAGTVLPKALNPTSYTRMLETLKSPMTFIGENLKEERSTEWRLHAAQFTVPALSYQIISGR